MRVLGFEFKRAAEFDGLVKRLEKLEEAEITRPALQHVQQLGSDGVRLPYYPYPPQVLYDLTMYCSDLRTILLALRRETFRNGIEIEAKWSAKCTNEQCGEEYQHLPEEEVCEVCGAGLREPDSKQKLRFEKLMKKCNDNEQTLQMVQEQINQDADTLDDGYMLVLKNYYFNGAGEVTGAEIREVLRGDPLAIRIIADKFGRPGYDDSGHQLFFCLNHRGMLWRNNETKCPDCGCDLYRAYFKADYDSGYTQADGQRSIYYTKGEVIHRSKYNPTLTYGFSPVASAWVKIMTLMWQETYIKDYYGKERPPRGLLFINTSNVQSLQKQWDQFKSKQRTNPHDINPIGMDFGEKSGTNLVQWIEFVRPLTEMQYTETRNEYRRALGAFWGVQPIFQSDIQQSGGLNNEGMQITVTNRSIESGQKYNDYFLGELAAQAGVTDWEVKLASVEVRDEMSELKIEEQKIANAVAMKNLGYDVELDEEGEFQYEKSETPIVPSLPPASPASPSDASLALPPSGAAEPAVKSKKKALKAVFKAELDAIRSSDSSFSAKAGQSYKLDYIEDSVYDGAFDGVNRRTSKAVKAYLVEASALGTSYKAMTARVARMTGLSEEEAERIVRTETHELKAKLRELAYSQTQPENAKYKWIGPSDHRTTKACRELVEETKSGVTLPKLKAMIAEKADAMGFKAREYTPHWNCRHTFVRSFG